MDVDLREGITVKHEYWITADLIGQSFKGTASMNFTFDRPLRPSDMDEIARRFRESPAVPSGTSAVVTSIFKFEGDAR